MRERVPMSPWWWTCNHHASWNPPGQAKKPLSELAHWLTIPYRSRYNLKTISKDSSGVTAWSTHRHWTCNIFLIKKHYKKILIDPPPGPIRIRILYWIPWYYSPHSIKILNISTDMFSTLKVEQFIPVNLVRIKVTKHLHVQGNTVALFACDFVNWCHENLVQTVLL